MTTKFPGRNHGVALALVLTLAAAPAVAREVAGVTMPDTVEVAERTLRLNGAGLRTRFFFKVYVIGLYLPRPARTAQEVLDGERPQRVVLHVLRSLEGAEIADAIGDGFARNAGDDMPRLSGRLARLKAMFPAVEPGDRVELTVTADSTDVVVQGTPRGSIEGADFGRALLAVWLGADPVDDALKRALLGQ